MNVDVRRAVEQVAAVKGFSPADYLRSAIETQLAADRRVVQIMALPEATGDLRELARCLATETNLDVAAAQRALRVALMTSAVPQKSDRSSN